MTVPRSLLFFALFATLSFGSLTPTSPGPGNSFNAGSSCPILWEADTTGSWTNVTIDLMSGSNNNMSLVTNVVSGLDGTNSSLTPYLWTCPGVDPNSAIYFYQFTSGNHSAKWTTRFTIASSAGNSVQPEHSLQPNGDAIPWGVGYLTETEECVDSQKDEDEEGVLREASDSVSADHTPTGPVTSTEQSDASVEEPPSRSSTTHNEEPSTSSRAQLPDNDQTSSNASATPETRVQEADTHDISSSFPPHSSTDQMDPPIASRTVTASSENRVQATDLTEPDSRTTSSPVPSANSLEAKAANAAATALMEEEPAQRETDTATSTASLTTDESRASLSAASLPVSTPTSTQCQCPGVPTNNKLNNRSFSSAISSRRVSSDWTTTLVLAFVVICILS